VATKKSTEAKSTTVKKAAAKKPAAKKPAAKKPAAKKPAAKKPAAKKPAATKAAAAKKPAATKAAAAKKPAATKAAAAKKPAGKKTPAPKIKPPPKKPVKVPFHVGDKVVYPHHGAATIIKKEKIEFDGEKQDYFVLEIVTDQLIVRVPVVNAIERGVRPVISKNQARKVFATLKAEPNEAGSNWSRWYKVLTEKINSGDIFQVAEVVRDLDYSQKKKGISPALKRMLAKARLIIISELRFSLKIEEEEAIRRLDRSLRSVEVPEEV
jgi:CarD family transcriptional regulator